MFWACLLNLGNFAMRMKLTIFFLVNARLYDREMKFVEISMIIRRLYSGLLINNTHVFYLQHLPTGTNSTVFGTLFSNMKDITTRSKLTELSFVSA